MKKPLFVLFCAGCLSMPVFAADTDVLPLKDVVLFSSGVGYFGRTGTVNGNADLDLKFRAPQMGDILKSLVLLDPKGQVKPVFYSVEDWMKQRAVQPDLVMEKKSTFAEVLQELQGAEVRIEFADEAAVEGDIVAVSDSGLAVTDQINNRKEEKTVPVLTLLTKDGLKPVRMEFVDAIVFKDPLLNERLRASLKKKPAGLTAADDQMRGIKLSFAGQGAREVTAAYLQETPVWKTSYRLVLKPNGKPYLQGWSIVENTTDENWKNVRLTMVSGRPISFIQNLSAPLYVSRPLVQPLVVGSLTPQTYGAGIEPIDTAPRPGGRVDTLDARVSSLENRVTAPPRLTTPQAFLHQSGAANYINNMNSMPDIFRANPQFGYEAQQPPMARGEEKGELFSYAVDAPISLEKGKAAMIPIIGTDIGGDVVSVVSSTGNIGGLTALNGYYLNNNSGLHLPAGPITVFADNIYAGDALTLDITPHERRLISYAQDFDLLPRLDKDEYGETVSALTVEDGVLRISKNVSKKQIFLLKNRANKAKEVFLLVPQASTWELIEPKQAFDTTNEGLRFRVNVKPKETRVYEIKSQSVRNETATLSTLDLPKLTYYAGLENISPEVRKVLNEVAERRRRWQRVSGERAAKERALADITADQTRIRSNMEALSETSALRKQYEAKLAAQEPKVDALREDIARLRDEEAEAEKEFGGYTSKLQAK